jgi:pimeloyl-ACP methyl ester carboxylesterase
MERTLANVKAAAEAGAYASAADVTEQRPTTSQGDEPALRVRSRDGAEIACWQGGDGPPLVLVHGAPADHTRWRPLLPYLEPHFTVYTLDRRGRGASTDAPDYALEREFEDIAAIIDDIFATCARPVSVYGHSFGGNVAFGAATITSNIDRLVLYEGWPVPDPSVFALPSDLEAHMDALFTRGDHDGVVELLFRGLENLSNEDMAAFKAAPSWQGRVAAAPTITREIRGLTTARLDVDIARTITVPVLLLTGEHSADPAQPHAAAVAKALPNARTLMLEDQEHVADVLDPELFSARVLPFLKGDG